VEFLVSVSGYWYYYLGSIKQLGISQLVSGSDRNLKFRKHRCSCESASWDLFLGIAPGGGANDSGEPQSSRTEKQPSREEYARATKRYRQAVVLRQKCVRARQLEFPGEWSNGMLAIILCLFRIFRLLGSGHQAVAVENLALRLQLAAFKRKRKRPVLTQLDRLFWVGLSQFWNGWRGSLVFVRPDTVVRWQRDRFRRFWARLSQLKPGRRGRPAVAAETRRLVLQIATANPLWRAPRIHGELKMLGIMVSERAV
jgi:hypothetical protein